MHRLKKKLGKIAKRISHTDPVVVVSSCDERLYVCEDRAEDDRNDGDVGASDISWMVGLKIVMLVAVGFAINVRGMRRCNGFDSWKMDKF